jgi:hypothetical protein
MSNDPQNAKAVLSMQGTVKTLIDVRPSTNVSFRGLAEKLSPSIVEMEASGGQTFHIHKVESNLEDKVSHELETVVEGKHYRMKLANRIEQGNYNGFFKLQTDLSQKPDIVIRVNGFIEGEIRVQPQILMVGKLGAQQPPRTGRVRVTNNREKPFQITKVTYDHDLLEVVQQPVPNEPGYSLEIKPRIENLPAGERKQTIVVLETDARPSEKYEIQVHLMNAAEAAQAGGGTPLEGGQAAPRPGPSPTEAPKKANPSTTEGAGVPQN